MDFNCFKCEQQFEFIKEIISHLKGEHNVEENDEQIYCVCANGCQKYFYTFFGLRSHVKLCLNNTTLPQNVCKKQISKREEDLNFCPFDEYENELATAFEFRCTTSDFNAKVPEPGSNAIRYIRESRTQEASSNLHQFIEEFIGSISKMKLQEKQMNKIIGLIKNLVRNVNKLNWALIEDDNMLTTDEALKSSTTYICNELSRLDSSYKRDTVCILKSSHVQPKAKAIGTRWELKKVKRKYLGSGHERTIKIPRLIQCSFQYISILKTLDSVFSYREFRDMYFDFNSEKHQCVPGKYISFCCGDSYKRNSFFRENPDCIQIQLAWDDFEVCAPLKSKAKRHKICAVYFTIKNVPSKYLSKLANIYVVALVNSDDLRSKSTDMNDIWYPIVNELKVLETTGIQVLEKRIRGTLIQAVSDNLGANVGLGFSAGFAKGPHFCRICEAEKMECDTMTRERASQIRTKESYERHIKIISQSTKVQFRETKGVKFYCLLSNLNAYHIIDSPTVDIMHDLNEGVIPFVLKALFEQMISKKIISEELLNNKIQFFDYGWLNRRNVPSHIKLDTNNLGQNASQSRCLMKFLPFILNDHLNDNYMKRIWPCIESLLRIVEISYSPEITEIDIIELEKEIHKLLSGLQIDFNRKLTPKLHFLTHYPNLIRLSGPLTHMSMFRYEAKHKQLKTISENTNNFRNINKTIASKHQKWFSGSEYTYKDEVEHGKPFKINHSNMILWCQKYGQNMDYAIQEIYEIKSLTYNSFEYKCGIFITFCGSIFEIKTIVADINTNQYFFICQMYTVQSYNRRLNSFEIKENINSEKIIIDLSRLTNIRPYEITEVDYTQFVIADTSQLRKSLL